MPVRSRHRSLTLPDALVIATAEHGRPLTVGRDEAVSAKVMKLTVSIELI